MTVPPAGAALVLGSGGARAAYEVGVARYLFEDLHTQLGHPPAIRIYSGTSGGALNACVLAAFAHQPLAGVALLARRWSAMRLDEMVRLDRCELLRMTRALVGRPGRNQGGGSLLDPAPLEHLVRDAFPGDAIEDRLREGTLQAVAMGTTEVATGRTKVFVRRAPNAAGGLDPTFVAVREGDLRPEHALASAAIPLLFPAVDIDGRRYCDGSLRQSVPLSPAHHLGADRILAVTTQHQPAAVPPWLAHERARAVDSPIYVLGKAVNALHLDRMDEDLDRLRLVNDILGAGERAYGATFLATINKQLAARGREVRPLQTALVRPSESLGRLAADHVSSRAFRRRKGMVVSAFVRLVELDAEHEADLVSYLLFDGPFVQQLIELGHADARAQSDRLLELLGEHPRGNPANPAAD